MYEIEIRNIKTGEIEIIYGYNYEDAQRRNPQFNYDEYKYIHSFYID